jgi:sirohydrochlorin ferrochelatase
VKALLIMAHGSPRTEANDDIVRIAGVLRARNAYPIVTVSYLDCNQPDIAAGVDQCVAAGATEIDAVPYVLHSGKHFVRDIPAILNEAIERHPHVRILMGDYIGHMPAIADVILARVRAAS